MLYQLSYSRLSVDSPMLTGYTSGSSVGRGGFEPPKAEPPDLQSGPVGRLGTCPTKRTVLQYARTQDVVPYIRENLK